MYLVKFCEQQHVQLINCAIGTNTHPNCTMRTFLALIAAAAVSNAALLRGHQAQPTQNIVQLASATADLSTLVAAVKAGGLVDTLSSKGPFTVFAPSNEAFAKLPKATLDSLLKPENKAKLVDILTYHVVAGAAVFAKDLKNDEQIKTVEGKTVTAHVSGTSVKINDATVTTANVAASNGVVHIIDTVLLPPAMLAEVEFEFTAVIE